MRAATCGVRVCWGATVAGAVAVAAEAVASVDALAAGEDADDAETGAGAGADSQSSRGMIEVAFSTLAAKSHDEQRSRSSKPVGVT